MVGELQNLFHRAAQSASLALVRTMLRMLSGNARSAFAGRVMTAAFTADTSATFDAFVKLISRNELAAAQHELLFERSCDLLDTTYIQDSIIEAFKRASGVAVHYSQEGEDIILARLWGSKRNGYFVDVGAHHATRFSNTYALYRKGWRGINIDATPGSMDSFRKLRPDDTNLEIAVSDKTGPLVLNVFKEGALNTFDSTLSGDYTAAGWEKLDTVELQPRPLADVLDQYVAAGQTIDLLSIDVEGEDLGVLRSNNWGKYCPEVIIIEALDTPLTMLHAHPAITFLSQHGYTPMARLYNSVILRRVARTCVGS